MKNEQYKKHSANMHKRTNRNGKKFVGTELNPKRVSVLLKEVSKLGGKYIVKDLFNID